MPDDRPDQPLARRVPGASNVGPAVPPRRPLPDGLVERMRAAVDAAHAEQAVRGTSPADAVCDLILHQAAEEEPGSLWTPAARRRRLRAGFALLRLWR